MMFANDQKNLLFAALIGLGLLFDGSVNAQQAVFRQFNKQEGLSQSAVFAVAQDDDGFLWFGTRDGLNQYDGYHFKVYWSSSKTNSLISNDVRVLYYDPFARALWVGTLDGLSRYDAAKDAFENFTTDNGLSFNSIRCILRDSKQRLWVGTANGLNWYDATKNRFTQVAKDYTATANVEIETLLEDRQGNLWVGTEEGLKRLITNTPTDFKLEKVLHSNHPYLQLADYRIKTLVEDAGGNLWIGTEGGLHYWNRSQNTIEIHRHDPNNPYSLSNDNVRSLALAPDGTLWVGTFVGLNRLLPDRRGFQRFLKDERGAGSLSHSSIRAVFFDRRGKLWLGTYHGGVNYYDPNLSQFKNYEHLPNRNSLSNNIVSSFWEEADGNCWIGTEGGGLNYWNRKTDTFTAFEAKSNDPNSLSGNNVKVLFKDGQQLWIGTFAAGLNVLDVTTRRFRHFKHDPKNPNSLRNNNVYSLYKEGDYLWIVTYGGGLNVWNVKSKKFHIYKKEVGNTQSLSSDLGRVIFKNRQQRLWIGTEDGLNLVQRDSVGDLKLRFRHFLPKVKIYTLFEDKQGTLWIGTFSDGLFAFNPTDYTYRQYTEKDGLPGHSIFGILQDTAGRLWLSTNNGIAKFNLQKKVFTNYNHSNGLKNLEFNFNAYHQSRSGELFFGGVNGFTVFRPTDIVPNETPPPVVFTDLKVFNRTVAIGHRRGLLSQTLNRTAELTFPYNEANFSIGFAALDYFNPSNNRYAFLLEGLDKNWNYRTGQTEATYTLQRPGTYRFRLKAANSDGVWNPEERQLRITVLPPPWRTGWAYAAYTLVLAGALYGVWRFIRLRHRLQLEQLAKQQQEELNEMKLRFFTNITHEFRTPLTLILGPLEELLRQHSNNGIHRQLHTMQRNAQRLLHLVNQILTFRKLESDHEQMQATKADLIAFLQDIFQSFAESARLRSMDYRFECFEGELWVWFDADKLEKVFFNLLSNAFKFTPDGGEIVLQLKQYEGKVEIRVQDNGNGIKPELHGQIFKRFYEKVAVPHVNVKGSGIGLALSKQMIELHQGSIRVESELGRGATFVVELPLGRNHLKPEEIVETEAVFKKNGIVTNKDFVLNELEESVATAPTDAPLLLIVEDNPEISAYLQHTFRTEYRLLTAPDGKTGLQLAKKHLPDLLLSDVMMPQMDGNTLCQKIKTDLKTSHIPVILLTARTEQAFKIEGLQTGADDYVTKPFYAEELRLRLRNLLQNRQKMREKFVRVLHFEPKEITVTSADEDFLQRALAIAEKHIEDADFTAEQFAYELAVSRPLLFTKLKALTDQTPNNFVKTLRLKRAAQLLAQRKLNVAEVAYKVGFRDTRYFSKCFQQQFQKTPSEYMAGSDIPNF
jgi:signal transduction histidine kinase/DNA-binding response OmpR family regulator/streptogramin lyase